MTIAAEMRELLGEGVIPQPPKTHGSGALTIKAARNLLAMLPPKARMLLTVAQDGKLFWVVANKDIIKVQGRFQPLLPVVKDLEQGKWLRRAHQDPKKETFLFFLTDEARRVFDRAKL